MEVLGVSLYPPLPPIVIFKRPALLRESLTPTILNPAYDYLSVAKNFHALYCGGDHEDWLLNLPVRSTIFIVEGEKDVINMRMAGMNAVSAIGWGGAWLEEVIL